MRLATKSKVKRNFKTEKRLYSREWSLLDQQIPFPEEEAEEEAEKNRTRALEEAESEKVRLGQEIERLEKSLSEKTSEIELFCQQKESEMDKKLTRIQEESRYFNYFFQIVSLGVSTVETNRDRDRECP